MQTYFQEYLKILQTCHTDILKGVDGLQSVALDWVPGQDMNSINVLVFHLTGAEQYWISDVAAQKPSQRDRDAEFKVHSVDVSVLKKRLEDNLTFAASVLDTFDLADLGLSRISPRDGREVTVAWALLHALEHSMLHLGQIQLTRQLWEQREQAS
ncbi:MAG: DinB family protein [Anaerolineales bacterium]|nr:DinB family protein [Anaerolineales bacterium]